MNNDKNNITGPAPLPGEPETQPKVGQEQPEPAFVTPPSPPSSPPPPFPPLTPPSPLPSSPPSLPPTPPFQPFPPQPRVGQAGPGPAIPSSPPPDIGIRTMASDLSSLKSSGGLEAKPKTFQPEEFSKEQTFKPKETMAAGLKSAKPVSVKPHSKVLFIVLFIIGFVLVAGLVIYFLIMPIIFPKAEVPIIEAPPPAETAPGEVTTPSLTHQTYFITTPASTVAINLNNLNLAEVNSALNVASSDIQPQTIREITFTAAGAVPEAAGFLSLAFPELNSEFIKSSFEKDFTVFLYRDNNGSWPGYIFRLSSNAVPAEAANVIKTIESSANIVNLYLSETSTASQAEFKDGLKINETKARYLSFNTPGASFNYGWFNNHLVISASFAGFKEALKLLGFSLPN